MSRGKWTDETMLRREAGLHKARADKKVKRGKTINVKDGWAIRWFDELNYVVSHNGEDQGHYFSRVADAFLYICDKILSRSDDLEAIGRLVRELICVAQEIDGLEKSHIKQEDQNGN